jgi:Flp pilus assembly protein TadB
MRDLIIAGASLSLYILLAIGVVIAYYERICAVFERIRMIRRLSARNRMEQGGSQLGRRFQRFLHTSLGYSLSPVMFLFLSALIFLSVLVPAYSLLGPLMSFLLSFSATVLPCLILRIRMGNIRKKGSYEGERLVAEILHKYRICNFNIYEAIERTINSAADLKVSGRLLSKLLLELRNTGNPRKIKNATEDISYGINTNWGRMLAHNIYIAASKGSDVSIAIEDILIQLRKAKTVFEERKRLNNEAVRMTFFMVPITYFTTAIMAVAYLDVPLMKFLKNQFGTREGVLLFYFIIFIFVVNIALLQLVTNRRFDY